MECSDNSKKKSKKKGDKKEDKKQEKEEEEEDLENISVLNVTCKDSMNSNEYLVKKNFKPGDMFDVLCLEDCLKKAEAKVFGSRVYSEDSSICKSSQHMGVNMVNKQFKVIVERFRNMYESSSQNGITSNDKITNTGSKSITFQAIKDSSLKALDDLKINQKLDIYDQKKQKWTPGFIRTIDRRKLNLLILKIAFDGFAPEFDESIQFPSPDRIDYCGNKITTR